MFFFKILLFCFFVCFYSSCAFAEDEKIKSLEQYYLDGIYEYVDRNYTTATEQFEALSHNYPSSMKTKKSLIMEAFLDYINDEAKKIDGVVEVFFRLFPNDEQAPYMKYIKAMGYYSYVGDDARSLDAVMKSKLLFEDLVATFPESIYAKEAEKKIEYLDKLMQLNDIKIGELYFNRRNYVAAMKRYTGMYQKHKKLVPEIEERVLCRLVVLSKMFKIDENIIKYEKILKEKFKETKCEF